MKTIRIAPLALFTILLTLTQAAAAESQVYVRFSNLEISVIADFYRDDNSSKSKGRKSAKGLPPGIEKNLQRGKRLPPGIAKQSLPGNLQVKLPPAPDGYERMVVAGKVLLIEIATQIIHDVLTDLAFD